MKTVSWYQSKSDKPSAYRWGPSVGAQMLILAHKPEGTQQPL